MSFRLEFELDGLPQTGNATLRGGWKGSFYRKKEWKQRVVGKCEMPDGGPLKSARVILTRFSSAEPDYDGLVTSFKGVIDGLVEGRVIADDKSSVIGIPIYRWERASPGKGKIRVIVQEVTKELQSL